MRKNEGFDNLLLAILAQGKAFERRAQSLVEKRYGNAMLTMAETLGEFVRTASFDKLIRAEKAFQKNDLAEELYDALQRERLSPPGRENENPENEKT